MKNPLTTVLKGALLTHQPELLGRVNVEGSSRLLTIDSLLLTWCTFLEGRGSSFEEALGNLLGELARTLRTKAVASRFDVPVSHCKLAEGVEQINIGQFKLRRFTDADLEHYSARDIGVPAFPHGEYDPFDLHLVVERDLPASIELSSEPSSKIISRDTFRQVEEELRGLLSALHILKPGAPRALSIRQTMPDQVLPVMGLSTRGWTPYFPRFPTYVTLDRQDEERLEHFYSGLKVGRESVRVAAARLADAEHRGTPMDALVDCAVGLDALFLGGGHNELTFRVQLCYASLWEGAERLTRAKAARDLYSLRGKIVHGSVIKPIDIEKPAERAKDALRSALVKFLDEPELRGASRLDQDYWTTRILRTA